MSENLEFFSLSRVTRRSKPDLQRLDLLSHAAKRALATDQAIAGSRLTADSCSLVFSRSS